MFVLRFLFYFSLSFIILSFPIQRKAAFYHINKLAAPYTTQLFTKMGDKIEDLFSDGAKAGKRLFTNTLPPVGEDQIKSRLSSTKKSPVEVSVKEDHVKDDYTVEEKEMLNKIFNRDEEE